MAHFDMSINDFLDNKALFAKVSAGQKNYTPTGEQKPLVTSESKDLTPKKGLTTVNVSDILQNQLVLKDQGMVKTQFNEVLSKDMSTLLGLSIDGQRAKLSKSNASLVGYDILLQSKSNQITLESMTQVTPAGRSPVTTSAKPTPSGFVFPLLTTKSKIREGLHGAVWPSENQNNVHHDYNAADIFAETGTTVVAAMGGKVISANNNGGEFGSSVRIEGQDGYWYYYVHMGVGTVGVSEGQQVASGAVLGNVGLSSDAQNTTPHLHFDISPQENGFMRGYGGAQGPLINPQPWLIEAFQLLPE